MPAPQTDDPAVAAYLAGAEVRDIMAAHGITSHSSLYWRLQRAGVALRTRTAPRQGLTVYNEAGEVFARSVRQAAAILGGSPDNLARRHLAVYRDGYQITSRPRPRRKR